MDSPNSPDHHPPFLQKPAKDLLLWQGRSILIVANSQPASAPAIRRFSSAIQALFWSLKKCCVATAPRSLEKRSHLQVHSIFSSKARFL
jgi:hypothetical protein